MKRFVLGFVLGCLLGAAVATTVTTWSGDQRDTPLTATPETPPTETPARAETPKRARVHAAPEAADEPAADASRAARASGPASGPAESGAIGDAEHPDIATLRKLTSESKWIALRDEVNRVRRENVFLVIPRDLVEAMWTEGVTNSKDPYAHEAARLALRSWREEALVTEIRGLANGDPASAAFRELSGELMGALAERPHTQLDLARMLYDSEDPHMRRGGLHLAATAGAPDWRMLEGAAREDPDDDTRCAGLQHLVNSAGQRASASRIAGALAVELFDDGTGSRRMRDIAVPALRYGGERGLDIAQRLLIEGGLSSRDARDLADGLVAAGRVPKLLAQAAGDRALLLALCESVFQSDAPRAPDVLALWPYIPRVIDTPEQDWTDWVPSTLVQIGRSDLAAELALNEKLSVTSRVSALYDLADSEGEPQRALELVRRILDDPDSSTDLRKEMTDPLRSVFYATESLRPAVLALLDRVASDDRNEWVRGEAEETAAMLREWAAKQR